MNIRDRLAMGGLKREELELIVLKTVAPAEDRSFLAMHDEQELTEVEQEKIARSVAERKSGVPLAYVLGSKEFYGRKFNVAHGAVLIPRPETEVLVDLVKELNPNSIVDVGTGSGCIAVTLALELPDAFIVGLDNSTMALEVARSNAVRYELLYEWEDPAHASEYFGLLKADLLGDLEISADVIVANLPYVDKSWEWVDEEQLKYEPAEALYADDGGLAIIKKLIDQIAERKCAKYVVLEADPCQHERLVEYAARKSLKHMKTKGFGLVFSLLDEF